MEWFHGNACADRLAQQALQLPDEGQLRTYLQEVRMKHDVLLRVGWILAGTVFPDYRQLEKAGRATKPVVGRVREAHQLVWQGASGRWRCAACSSSSPRAI